MENCEKTRCAWVDPASALYAHYHDEEWGVPVHTDTRLFEFLLLECFQAGLSWLTILKKREAFRAAFDQFDPVKIAAYGDEKITALCQNPKIIRNASKIRAAICNAAVFLHIKSEFGSFSDYLWGFTGGRVIRSSSAVRPVKTALSDQISADLRRRGMKFVGSVTIYAYLQAVGVVDDHDPACFKHTGTQT